jgi:hypothetical protein
MACFANGSATKLYYIQEEADGSIDATAPNFKPLRFVSEGLSPNISQIENDEINTMRQRAPSRGGTYSVQGELSARVSLNTYDDLIEAAMQGTWTANVLKVGSVERTFAILERHTDISNAEISAITLSAAAADDSFNDSGNGFLTAGFKVGDFIAVSGFTGDPSNNSVFKIATVTAGKITVTSPTGAAVTLVDDAAGETVTIVSNVDYIYRGCRVATMNITAPLGDKAGITFGFVGTKAELYAVPADAVFVAPNDKDIMVTTNGSFTEDGTAIAYATEWNVTLDNGMEAAFSLFQREAYCVTNGVASVSGSMNAYLKDGRLWAKVLDESASDHVVVLEEGADTYTITLPNLRYTQGQKQVGGPGAVIPQYSYSAGYDATEATTIKIQRSS